MSNTRCVLYWKDAEKVSIEDIKKVTNEEDRWVGAITSIKVGNKVFSAVVRMISKEDEKLQACEDEVAAEIEAKIQKRKEEEDKLGRKSRAKRKKDSVEASERQVNAALGKKVKASSVEEVQKKILNQAKKDTEAAFQSAQVDVDEKLVGARRILNFSETNDDEQLCSEGEGGDPATSDFDSSDEDKESDEPDVDTAQDAPQIDTTCCLHCKSLRAASCKSPECFVTSLVEFLAGSKSSSTLQESVMLQPLMIPKGVPKCEISKGSGVYMSVHDKNDVKSESQGDPAKMTREVFLKLFGRDTLEQENVTAVGARKGCKGIPENVRKAVLSFVNRNRSPQYAPLKKSRFHSIINKKKSQVQRSTKGTPPSGSKKSQKGKMGKTSQMSSSVTKAPNVTAQVGVGEESAESSVNNRATSSNTPTKNAGHTNSTQQYGFSQSGTQQNAPYQHHYQPGPSSGQRSQVELYPHGPTAGMPQQALQHTLYQQGHHNTMPACTSPWKISPYDPQHPYFPSNSLYGLSSGCEDRQFDMFSSPEFH